MTLSKIALIVSLGAAATAAFAVALVLNTRHERLHYIPLVQPDDVTQFFPITNEPEVYTKRAPMIAYNDLIKNDCESLKKIEAKTNVTIVVDSDFEVTASTFLMTISGRPADCVLAEAQINDLLIKIVDKKCTPTHQANN